MTVRFLHTQSFTRVLHQQAPHEGHALRAVLVPNFLAEHRLNAQNVFHHFLLVVAPEGRPPHHHHVHYDPCGPDVAALVVVLEQHFWSHVVGGPYSFGEDECFLFFLDCDAEVDDFEDVTVFFEEHVFGFEVAVHDALVFEVEEHFEDLFDDAGDVGFAEVVVDQYFFEEFTPFAEFEDEDIVGFVVVDFEEFGDVGVIEGLHDGHFCEQFFVVLLGESALLDFFGSPEDAGVLGPDFVDFSEAAPPDFLDDDVVVEVVFLFHLDETVPLDLDLADCLFFLLVLLHQVVLFLVQSQGSLSHDLLLHVLNVQTVVLEHYGFDLLQNNFGVGWTFFKAHWPHVGQTIRFLRKYWLS